VRIWLAAALLVLACNSGGSTGDDVDAQPSSDAPADQADAPAGGGCGASGAATGAIDDSMVVRGETRTFILSVPSTYDSQQQYALVFAWHGLGSNAAQARLYFGVEQASAGAAIVVYPNGLPKYGDGTQQGWDLALTGEDFELFDALVERITADYCVDPARVFATGHSFGGYMSNNLACGRGDVLRAIAPVAGGPPYFSCAANGTAAWIAHGIDDSTVLFSEGEASRDHWRDHNGCDDTTAPIDPAPCVAYENCDVGYPVVWCAHEETTLGGHGWPSFAPDAIWPFFAGLD
jgi:poly(3-hydroxybutyrate) depolymerase